MQNTLMKAIQFDVTVPRYLLGKVFGSVYKPFFWSGLSCLHYGDAPEPTLPGPDWVKIKTRYGGICGTDWGLVRLHTSLYFSAFGSEWFIPGHENLGTIVEVGARVEGWQTGERVVADLLLPCTARGYTDPCPACRRGDYNQCHRFAEGSLAPGMMLGSSADTGGSWGQVYVAHQSQLVRVPEGVSDENAVLLEPFSAALHPTLRHLPGDEATVLVLGAGTIGLCAVAALRALGSQARILVLAKYDYQGDLARQYGADEVLQPGRNQDHVHAVADLTGGRVYQAMLSKPAVVGGADLVYECVGSDSSVDDALRLVTAGGSILLLGSTSVTKTVNWTPLWFRELTVSGSYAGAMETYQGRNMSTFQVGLELMDSGKLDLAPMLTHKYPLAEYRQAFRTLASKAKNRALKVVFAYD
jgi:threonine dehydrogenase-like Zn-dependent dehydrogenase